MGIPGHGPLGTESESDMGEVEQPELSTAAVMQPGSFTLTHACLSWSDGDACVLNDLCVSVRPGTLVAVCGRVGCGKSSLSECPFPAAHDCLRAPVCPHIPVL
jgi:ABC-type transport system involved in cytochrome bd biosynthesis fused ATPase/permease subunit